MPKLKTKSGVKKRFKLTATGKVKHGVAGKRHRLISHNAKYIRQNRGTSVIADADARRAVMERLQTIMRDDAVTLQPYWRSLYRHAKPGVVGGDMHIAFLPQLYKLGFAA